MADKYFNLFFFHLFPNNQRNKIIFKKSFLTKLHDPIGDTLLILKKKKKKKKEKDTMNLKLIQNSLTKRS